MSTGAILGFVCLALCLIGVAYLMATAPPMPPDDLPEPPAPVYQPQLTHALNAVDGRLQVLEGQARVLDGRMSFVGQLADKVVGALERLAKLEERLAAIEASQGRADRARVYCAAKLAEAALALEGLEPVAIDAAGKVEPWVDYYVERRLVAVTLPKGWPCEKAEG